MMRFNWIDDNCEGVTKIISYMHSGKNIKSAKQVIHKY